MSDIPCFFVNFLIHCRPGYGSGSKSDLQIEYVTLRDTRLRCHLCRTHPRIYTRSGQLLLVDLLKEAERAYRSLEVGSVRVYRAQRAPWHGSEWVSVGAKQARPLESVVLEEGASSKLVDDVKEFMDSREWYRQRGIPFRRGYLMVSPSSIKCEQHSLKLRSVRPSGDRKDLFHCSPCRRT